MPTIIKDAAIRALRTFCQALVVLIGSDYIAIYDLDWVQIIGTAATMALVSFLTGLAGGLPETELKAGGSIIFTPEWDAEPTDPEGPKDDAEESGDGETRI